MQRQNRRTFVRNGLVAGSSTALMLPAGGVHSQQEPTADKSALSQINVAILGVNGRGGAHIEEILRADGATITYICDVDSGVGNRRADTVGEKQGRRPTMVQDLRRVLDDKTVDAITIATPNHWHALAAIWAMQAGKDAYVEKPVCHNLFEGASLIAAARKYNRICQVGTQCRSSQAVIDAVEFVQNGGIGEVNFARGLCYKRRKAIGPLGDYAIPAGVDFNLWSGPATYTTPRLTRPNFHYDWHWQRHYGNGDLGNQGPHQTDIARWGLGLDRHPNSVISYGGRLGYQVEKKDPNYVDAGDTANTEVSIYDYGDKCIVFETRGLSVDDSADEELNRLFGSTKGNKIGVVFYGDDGFVVQKSYNQCDVFDKNLNLVKEFRVGGNLNSAHFDNFLAAVRTRDVGSLNADVREGHLSAAISHLGNISYYVGERNRVSVEELERALTKIKSLDDNRATLQRTVAHLRQNGVDLDKYPLALGPHLQFDPEREVFLNSDEANGWLTREYREEFRVPSADQV
ncbi:MAG: gfo/Idh/MocA family oxidoreductase [Planctomycetota bacterium]|nr:MAG: gfo/Idh/MocA family oxidoreductase [Planctomycetota bacterium]